ncbi:MAG: DUF1080 domain-containing protein [Opitutae bacterium]|nr:DUF1080 domain-containing protein [Opitutae bacterium]
MKSVIAFLLFSITTFAGAEIRKWTSFPGSSMNAELIEFRNRVVSSKSSSGKRMILNINQLVVEDQVYLENWPITNKLDHAKKPFIKKNETEISLCKRITVDDSDPVGNLYKREELIVSTPFNQPTPLIYKGLINDWKVGKGAWRVESGVLHGDELPDDKHASSCTFRLEATDLIIQAQFKLGTAKLVSFGCRDNVPPNLHLARTFVSPDSIWIQTMSGIAKTTKSQKLVTHKALIDPNSWHHILIEILGGHYRVTLGNHIVEARHERFKDAKGIIALITKGTGAQFKNISIWRAKENL